jgi:hypothetical protein
MQEVWVGPATPAAELRDALAAVRDRPAELADAIEVFLSSR